MPHASALPKTSRRAFLALSASAAALALPVASMARTAVPEGVKPIKVDAKIIPSFQASNPSQKQFGKLEFRGGLQLTSSEPTFGGWSGLTIEPDGKRFLAISDEGAWLAAEIAYNGHAPAGITNARVGPVLGPKGRQLDRKRDLDAESIKALDGNLSKGNVLVAFERKHRIGVFPVQDGALQAPVRFLKLPPEALRMKSNSGFESVEVLKGGAYKGAIIAFSERFPGPTADHVGWMWINGEPHRLTMADHGGFEVTDAASLADGSLLVLERRFRWTEGVKMQLRRIPAATIKPGAKLDGDMLLQADMAYQIDNMEGLAVHTSPTGETVLTLLSDDNFNHLIQRTLLLQFTLPGAP